MTFVKTVVPHLTHPTSATTFMFE